MRLEVRPAGADQRRPGTHPRHRATHRRQVPHQDARHHLPGVAGAGRHRSARSTSLCAGGRRGGARRLQHPDPLRPRGRCRQRRRSRRCWRTSAVHQHLVRAGPAHRRPAWSSRPARRAKCTTSRLLAGYGAEAIHPYLAFETIQALLPTLNGRAERRRGDASATSRRSARACSRSCPRWASRPTSPTAARRSSRRSACRAAFVDKYFTGTATTDRGHRPGRGRRGGGAPAPRRVRRRAQICRKHARRRRRVCLARCAARTTCGRPTTIAKLQHAVRGNNADTYKRVSRG